MAKLLLILASLAVYARRTPSTRHSRRRWRLPVGTPIAAQNRRSDGVRRPRARRYDYIGRKDPVTGETTCPWRKGRGKVQSGGSSGVQMAG